MLQLSKWDFEIAVLAWIASCCAVPFYPPMVVIAVLTTINFLHQRSVLFKAGDELSHRIDDHVRDDRARLTKLEKSIADVVESQNRIQAGLGGAMPMPRGRFG